MIFTTILFLLIPVCFSDKSKEFILDISEKCYENFQTNLYLPYTISQTDSRIISLQSLSSYHRQCSIQILRPLHQKTCNDSCVFLLVIELQSFEATPENLLKPGAISLVAESDLEVEADFSNFSKDEDYFLWSYVVPNQKFKIVIDFSHFAGSLKFILTAAKKLDHYEKCIGDEIFCTMNGNMLCISKQLECDGNLNCGSPNLFDEYCYNVSYRNDIILTLIYTTLLVAFILFIIFQILKSCVPNVADHFFVYSEDQEYTFVLTSQSLPPIQDSEIEKERTRQKPTDVHVY